MKIGIDVDDTLNMLSEPWAEWISKNHQPGFSVNKWTDWDLKKVVKTDGDLFEFLSLPGTFFHVPVQPDSQRVTQLLCAQHEVFIITAFHHRDHGLKDKCQWLDANFPHIPAKNIIYCNHKSMVNVDVLIDDGAHNFDGFNGFPILLDQPWNQKAVVPTRANGWSHVEEIFKSLRWLK